MRKRLMTILALVLGALMVASVAVAQEAGTEADGTVLRGQGVLAARGTGTAILNMGGELRMAIRGNVTITDLAGDATIVINDGPENGLEEAGGDGTTIVLDDFSGTIFVRGRRFRVAARGSMHFVARGHGTAFLQGHGVWRTRRNHGTWSQGGGRLAIE